MKSYGVITQMKPIQQYYHMVPLIFWYFTKRKLGLVLNFDFSTLGSERVKTRLQISFDTYMLLVYLLIVHSLFRPGICWWERGRFLPHPLPRPPALSQAFIITYFSPMKAREGQNRYNSIKFKSTYFFPLHMVNCSSLLISSCPVLTALMP